MVLINLILKVIIQFDKLCSFLGGPSPQVPEMESDPYERPTTIACLAKVSLCASCAA